MEPRPGGAEPTRDRAWHASRGLGSRRVRLMAAGISVGLHAIAIVLYTLLGPVIRPEATDFSLPTETRSDQAVPLIQLIEIDPVDPDRPDEPEQIEDIVASEAELRPPFIPGDPIGELVPPGPTAAERLRPNLADARLWAEPPPEFYELTIEQREELILGDRIVEWYDSVALARAAEDRLTDWTFRDGNGGRWGVADGKIYLGDVALPLPVSFGTPIGKRDVTSYRMWEFDELSRQSQRFLIEQSWKERAAAIRARRDRERAAARGDTIRAPRSP